jgi:hypothetical protein
MPAGERPLCAHCFRIRQLLLVRSLSIVRWLVYFIDAAQETPVSPASLFASSPRRTRSCGFVCSTCSDKKGTLPG